MAFDFKLYVITAENRHPDRPLLEVMERTLQGGADVLQLRDKTSPRHLLLEKAKRLRELTARYGVPFIVNDHPDIALAVHADGVHLGQEDMPIEEARALLGPGKIIGISTHSIAQARAAEAAGADYIGVGPVYPTDTKPGRPAVTTAYVRQAAAEIRIPFVAIGGITPATAAAVLAAGASRLCAVSAVVGHDDPAAVCRELLALIRAAGTAGPVSLPAAAASAAGAGRAAGSAAGAAAAGSASGAAAQHSPAAAAEAVKLTLNGVETTVRAGTLEELAGSRGLLEKRIVAEVDGVIVPRGRWSATVLEGGTRVELVHFVGGG